VTVLVDDQVLAAHLRGRPVLTERPGAVFTSGLWYVRLCLAVARRAGGALSGPFAVLPPERRRRAVEAVLSLPEDIGLLSLRQLGPVIGDLAGRHPPMNILTREALAATVTLDATLLMAEGNENRTLAEAVVREGLEVAVLSI
jgi:hypothetical protein